MGKATQIFPFMAIKNKFDSFKFIQYCWCHENSRVGTFIWRDWYISRLIWTPLQISISICVTICRLSGKFIHLLEVPFAIAIQELNCSFAVHPAIGVKTSRHDTVTRAVSKFTLLDYVHHMNTQDEERINHIDNPFVTATQLILSP